MPLGGHAKESKHMNQKNQLRKTSRLAAALVVTASACLFATSANAQVDPKFTFVAPDAPPPAAVTPPVEWKAQSKGGYNLSSGNSQTQNLTFGMNASRKEGNNKLALEGGIAYGKSKNLVPVADATNTVVSLDRQEVVSTNNWIAKGRYDRFLTANNSLYVSGQGAADKITGKKFFGGGQFGYSRQVFKNDRHLLVAELGYDMTYESYAKIGTADAPASVSIHSARVLVGETLKLTATTGIVASMEGLFNLNKETKAEDASNGSIGVKAFGDTRLLGKLAVTSTLYKSLSMGLGFTFKYDQNPSRRPLPGLPTGLAYPAATDYVAYRYADTVDTITEATLIYTFF
jgi:putative salt-induced outer membrane protein YdiY